MESPERTDASAACERALVAFVALGIALRVVRYLVCAPLWGDEAFLAASLRTRGFAELLTPLDYGQVAPPLFLALELAAVRLAGFHELALRFWPLVAGVASVLCCARLARLLLAPAPRVLAVAVLAVSYYPIRHAAEVKPYSSDLALALVLLLLAVEAARAARPARWLARLAVLAPFAVLGSFPSVFVAGGASLALVGVAWRRGARRAWLAFNAALVASFAALLFGFTAHAMAAQAYLFERWEHTFPPLCDARALLVWLVEAHTSHAFAHPLGGRAGSSALTSLCVAAGIVACARARRSAALVLLLAPFALTLFAACLRAYPYGGSARWMLHLAPAVCLLAGLGAARLLRADAARGPTRVRAALVVLALVGVGVLAQSLVRPYKSPHDQRSRDFARWFWHDAAQGAELVCLASDLGLVLSPASFERASAAQYLCNQWIYLERRRRGEPARLELVSAEHPLRCVDFRCLDLEYDEGARAAWLADMQTRYRLVATQRYDLQRTHKTKPTEVDRIEVHELVPR